MLLSSVLVLTAFTSFPKIGRPWDQTLGTGQLRCGGVPRSLFGTQAVPQSAVVAELRAPVYRRYIVLAFRRRRGPSAQWDIRNTICRCISRPRLCPERVQQPPVAAGVSLPLLS